MSKQSGSKFSIQDAQGKLGILIPGMGAVASTFIAGVFSARRNKTLPIGSLTQMGTIRIGKRTEGKSPLIKDYVSLARLEDIEFGGWDIFPDNMYDASKKAGVLLDEHLDPIAEDLRSVKPMTAVFSEKYIKNISGPNVKTGTLWEKAQALRQDIQRFKKEKNCNVLLAAEKTILCKRKSFEWK